MAQRGIHIIPIILPAEVPAVQPRPLPRDSCPSPSARTEAARSQRAMRSARRLRAPVAPRRGEPPRPRRCAGARAPRRARPEPPSETAQAASRLRRGAALPPVPGRPRIQSTVAPASAPEPSTRPAKREQEVRKRQPAPRRAGTREAPPQRGSARSARETAGDREVLSVVCRNAWAGAAVNECGGVENTTMVRFGRDSSSRGPENPADRSLHPRATETRWDDPALL